MKYKLIVSDIDGTLLPHNKELSVRTKALVDQYQGLGGRFTIATGRMEKAIQPIVNQLHIETPVIIYNGSSIVNMDSGDVIYQSRLDYQVAKAALNICQSYGLDPLLYIGKDSYIERRSPSIIKHEAKEKVECIEVGCLYDFLRVPPIKILFIGEEKTFDPFKDHLHKLTDGPLNFICSEHNYLELLPQEASKGFALEKLAQHLRIPLEDVIAVGDERNDISMVRTAGFGAAVKNASSELLQRADYVSDFECNEGVEDILYKVINDIEILEKPQQ